MYLRKHNRFLLTRRLSKWIVEDANIKEKDYEVRASLSDGEESFSAKVKVDGKKAKAIFEVENPKLWWTHDIGTPNLYQLDVELVADGEKVDEKHEDFGIRTIEVSERMKRETLFTFVLNGEKLFAKGANWIPIDSFIGAVPDSRYKQLIKMSKDANMNMLRVWGGGIYEKDVFYEECNRLGILVWQDFMFSARFILIIIRTSWQTFGMKLNRWSNGCEIILAWPYGAETMKMIGCMKRCIHLVKSHIHFTVKKSIMN